MKRGARQVGRGGFTLAEMIMAIALLAIFSVFIVQMFVKADQVSRKARKLDMAVACASNIADQWKMKTTEGVPEQVVDLRLNRQAGKTVTIRLDESFEVCEAESADYAAVLTIEPQDQQAEELWTLSIVIGCTQSSDSGPIYTLQTAQYFPKEVSVP